MRLLKRSQFRMKERHSNPSILPLRKRQPYAYWIVIFVSVLMVLSLMAGALLTLF